MIRKIICCFLTVLMCGSMLGGCGVKNEIDSLERYVSTEKDDIWEGHDLPDFPSPTSDEEYMLKRLRNTSLIVEGGIIDSEIKLYEEAMMFATVSVVDAWYGKAAEDRIEVMIPVRWLDQKNGSYAPRVGDHVILFLARISDESRTYEGNYYPRSSIYESVYILNPPDDALVPLRTGKSPSSLAYGTKEELRKAVKEALNDIANGTIEPLSPASTVVDAITDKYVKKYERKQKWRKLFSWFGEN